MTPLGEVALRNPDLVSLGPGDVLRNTDWGLIDGHTFSGTEVRVAGFYSSHPHQLFP